MDENELEYKIDRKLISNGPKNGPYKAKTHS